MRKRRSMATNDSLIKAIEGLRSAGRRDDVPLWKDLSRRLSAPRRNRAGVNVSSLARYTEKGDVVAVPGKVLGSGTIAHPLTVAACSFTASAREKITAAGGRCLSIEELVKENPKGSGVRIFA